MSLRVKQNKFAGMVAQLIQWCQTNGYELSLGEVYRTPTQARANAAEGKGIANSLHCDRLAIDINLFKDGVYLNRSDAYLPAGEFWESIGGAWGGRFGDGNHFSLADGGRK